jgi:hypothetical protein
MFCRGSSEDGPKCFFFGRIAWSIGFLLWAVMIVADWFDYEPITSRTLVIVLLIFGAIILAPMIDSLIDRRLARKQKGLTGEARKNELHG